MTVVASALPSRPSLLSTAQVDRLLRLDVDANRSRVIRAIYRHLAGGNPDSVVIDDLVEATSLRRSARRNSVNGLLQRAVADDIVALPKEVVDALATDVAETQRQMLAIEAETLAVARIAETVGTPMTILKGVATRHLDYEHPADRSYVDVDLLLPVDDHDAFARALVRSGYTAEGRPTADGPAFFKGSEFRSRSGVGVDLHTRLFRQSHARRDRWIDDRVPVSIGNTTLHALSPPWRLVHAAGHLTYTPLPERKHNIALDVIRLVAAGTDFDATLESARSLGVETAVAWGISLACAAAELDVDTDVLDRAARSRRPRAIATRAGFLAAERRIGREQLAHVLGVERRNRLRFVRSFVLPTVASRLKPAATSPNKR